MSKESERASGVPEGARRATGGAPEERRDGRGRWSAKRKAVAILRLLRGEDLETLSRELGVTAAYPLIIPFQQRLPFDLSQKLGVGLVQGGPTLPSCHHLNVKQLTEVVAKTR